MNSIAPPPSGGLELTKPVEAETTVETKPGASDSTIKDAAKEGRLSIRPQDLSPKIIEKLAEKFGPEEIVNKLTKIMSATKTINVGHKPFEVDDFPTQLKALTLLLQYQIGTPVSRSEVVTHNVDTMQTLETKMQKSPALRRAVGAMLDRADTGNAKPAKGREVTEAETAEAEEVLQEVPEQPETPVESEVKTKVKTRTMRDALSVRGRLDSVEAKYTR